MIHSVKFKAVLDTNVIYPIIIRDVLFWFAHYDLYTPKWSENIFAEWKTVMLRKGISEEEAEKRIQIANLAFLMRWFRIITVWLRSWNYRTKMIATL